MEDYEDEDEVEIGTELETLTSLKSMKSHPLAWYNSCYVTKRPLILHNDIKSST